MGLLVEPSTELSVAHKSALEQLSLAQRGLQGQVDSTGLRSRLAEAKELIERQPSQVVISATPYIINRGADGKLYVLLSERTYGALKGLLIPPGGGKVDPGENIWRSVMREWMEEMGRQNGCDLVDGATPLQRNRILDHQVCFVFNVEMLTNGHHDPSEPPKYLIDFQIPFLNRNFTDAYIFTEAPLRTASAASG